MLEQPYKLLLLKWSSHPSLPSVNRKLWILVHQRCPSLSTLLNTHILCTKSNWQYTTASKKKKKKNLLAECCRMTQQGVQLFTTWKKKSCMSAKYKMVMSASVWLWTKHLLRNVRNERITGQEQLGQVYRDDTSCCLIFISVFLWHDLYSF